MKIITIRGVFFLSWFSIAGMVLYPFVLYAKRQPSILIQYHEMIHVDQIRKNGWLYFYVSYFYEFFRNLISMRNFDRAYESISWEAEAISKTDAFRESLFKTNQGPFW